MKNPYLAAGLPPDAVAWSALAMALAALVLAVMYRERLARWFAALRTRTLLTALALSASLLSIAYVVYYLRGGPRIVDATSYLLEARAIAHGFLAFPVPEPSASFRGRFLITPPDSDALAVIFPPGYPALLAVFELAGSPLALGPILAALLVVSTYQLAKALELNETIARVAALLSVVCVALRYHTADTMSHGLCALLFTVSLAAAARGGQRGTALSGFCLGWLCAARPVTAVVASLVVLCVFTKRETILTLFAAAIPGVALLLMHQHAATGEWFGSSQLRYYALADGPPGCFRYGFGKGIGCQFEHGDFVKSRLTEGYGFAAAFGNTLRRLAVHALDIANAAPFAAIALYAAFVGRKLRAIRALTLASLGIALAYSPFYFEASYPGGGARLLADVLPLEHILVAFGLSELKWSRFALPVSLAGFALHTSYAHRLLQEREGGRPMFENQVVQAAQVQHGLMFVTTDHGFNIGHQPGRFNAQRDLVVARLRRDAHDFALWEHLGRPPTYLYHFDPSGQSRPHVEPFIPAPAQRFESEAEWPPLEVSKGWVHPDFAPCASQGRGLRFRDANTEILVRLPSVSGGTYDVHVGWVIPEGFSAFSAALKLVGSPQVQTSRSAAREGCSETVFRAVPAGPSERAFISTPGPNAILDYVSLHPTLTANARDPSPSR